MSNPLDPTIKENWQYHDEYEFWYMPYPGTNESQAEDGVRWRGFKPWEAAPQQEAQQPEDYTCLVKGLSVSRKLLKEWFPDEETHNKVLGMISLLQFNAEKAVEEAKMPEADQPEERRAENGTGAQKTGAARTEAQQPVELSGGERFYPKEAKAYHKWVKTAGDNPIIMANAGFETYLAGWQAAWQARAGEGWQPIKALPDDVDVKKKMSEAEKSYWAIHNAIISMTPMEACRLNLHSALHEAWKHLPKDALSGIEAENPK